MANLYVKRRDTDEIIWTVDLHGKTGRAAERVAVGLLFNMDIDTYYIDDEEVDYEEED